MTWTPTFTGGAGARRIALTLAISDYDHVRDLVSGAVAPEGLDLVPVGLPIEEIFFRAVKFREWDVCEMSMAKYVALRSQGDASLVAIPVFPSRLFRHSSIYVRRDGPIREPRDLLGRRVGLPEWAQTAAVYSRGFLAHGYGIPLDGIEWLQAGVNEPGRGEKVALDLPEGIRLRPRPDSTLNGLLVSGEVDAILTAHPPRAFTDGDPNIARLFEDHRPVEEAYWRETGVFPIMHTVAIRGAVLERFPWVAMTLLKAFEEAKRRSLARLAEMTASRYPVPWIQNILRDTQALFGPDPWPYGVDANRGTLETFVAYAIEQGVCRAPITVDELFPREVGASFRI